MNVHQSNANHSDRTETTQDVHPCTLSELLHGSSSPLTAEQAKDLRYIVDSLPLRTSAGKGLLYRQTFLTDPQKIEDELRHVQTAMDFLDASSCRMDEICRQLSQIHDIFHTLDNLNSQLVLSDVELFEVKHFALTAQRIAQLSQSVEIVKIPDLSDVVSILDPENTQASGFYIYDAYSDSLAEMRKKLRTADEEETVLLYQQSVAAENEIRCRLAQALHVHSLRLLSAFKQLSYLDVLIAKAKHAQAEDFCRPQAADDETKYVQVFNPWLKGYLNRNHQEIQPIDITFGNAPTLLTGINMGGKTVLLRTLALCQYLFQFGFFVPAQQACIVIKGGIRLCMEEGQNLQSGLSSFALEMQQIDNILSDIFAGTQLLVLIDEPARTTNPQEGRAIVTAIVELLAENHVSSFITTHYDNIPTSCRRLRVKGLRKNASIDDASTLCRNIDYSLIADTSGNSPREALTVARMLNIHAALIQKAEHNLSQ